MIIILFNSCFLVERPGTSRKCLEIKVPRRSITTFVYASQHRAFDPNHCYGFPVACDHLQKQPFFFLLVPPEFILSFICLFLQHGNHGRW